MAKKKTPGDLKTLRELSHLVSVGDATLKDFDLLQISTVEELAKCDATKLYEKLCKLKGVELDPCCEDVLQSAVAQAKNPKLPKRKTSVVVLESRPKGKASVSE